MHSCAVFLKISLDRYIISIFSKPKGEIVGQAKTALVWMKEEKILGLSELPSFLYMGRAAKCDGSSWLLFVSLLHISFIWPDLAK